MHQPLVPALAGTVGALLMTAALGPAVVHPGNIDWLMRGDFSLHFLGWHLYRAGPWTTPIGATPLLIWPVGSSVGLTDSIPIASFVFKLLDPLLPPVFQFIGLWLVLSVALQGVFGALLMQRATPSPVVQVLGAVLFVLSPPLLFRFGHAALTAHWLILAALFLYLGTGEEPPSARRAAAWAVLAAVSAATQPYILLMVAAIMAAASLRQFLSAPRHVLAISLRLGLGLVAAWVALWQSGSFMVPGEAGRTMGGFGAYSANLLTFVMPTEGQSLLSPGPIPYASGLQYEGYAYLGAGMLALAVAVLVPTIARARLVEWRAAAWRQLPLLLALLVLGAMAVGPVVTAGARTLATYDGGWWGPLLAFRTNGRMIWPLYYGLVTWILFAAARCRPRTAVALLAGAVLVQAIDVAGMTRFIGQVQTFGYRHPLNSRFWRVVPPHYARLVTVPSNLCDRNGFVDYLPFALLAGTQGLAINAGSTARYDVRRAAVYCTTLAEEVRLGLADPDSLYVVRADLLPTVAPAAASRGTPCEVVDGFGVCYATASAARWRDALGVTGRSPGSP